MDYKVAVLLDRPGRKNLSLCEYIVCEFFESAHSANVQIKLLCLHKRHPRSAVDGYTVECADAFGKKYIIPAQISAQVSYFHGASESTVHLQVRH